MLSFLGNYKDLAPIFLRLMLGMTMLFSHGLPKLLAPDRWENTGNAMASIGITFAPAFWGFMAGATETVGGVLILLGLATRPTSAVLVFVLFVAIAQNLVTAGTLGGGRAHPVDAAAGFLALMVIGAGKWSLDHKLGLDKATAAANSPSPAAAPAGART
jgi:putative oxidoreductase